MKARKHAAARLGAPIDTCKQCDAVFGCQVLNKPPALDWGTPPDERRRVLRQLIDTAHVRFLVREAPQSDEDGTMHAVQFHGPFCSEYCALDWMEPRRDAMRRVRYTAWDVYVGQWGGPLAGHPEVECQINARKVRAGQVWLPIGKI